MSILVSVAERTREVDYVKPIRASEEVLHSIYDRGCFAFPWRRIHLELFAEVISTLRIRVGWEETMVWLILISGLDIFLVYLPSSKKQRISINYLPTFRWKEDLQFQGM